MGNYLNPAVSGNLLLLKCYVLITIRLVIHPGFLRVWRLPGM